MANGVGTYTDADIDIDAYDASLALVSGIGGDPEKTHNVARYLAKQGMCNLVQENMAHLNASGQTSHLQALLHCGRWKTRMGIAPANIRLSTSCSTISVKTTSDPYQSTKMGALAPIFESAYPSASPAGSRLHQSAPPGLTIDLDASFPGNRS